MPLHQQMTLAECSQYHQTLFARPPAAAHGAAILLAAVLAAALAWSAATRAELVVAAGGRLRAEGATHDVYIPSTGRPEESQGRRVGAVLYREGDRIERDQELLRLDAAPLQSECERQQQALASARQEIERIDRLAELLAVQREAALAKSRAEEKQIAREIEQAREERRLSVQRAEAALGVLEDEEARYREARLRGVGSAAEMRRLTQQVAQAEADLTAARLPLDEERLDVQRRAAALLERDLDIRGQELALKRLAKLREAEALEINVADCRRRVESSAVRAPAGGIVVTREAEPGALLAYGRPAVTIAESEGLLVEAAVSSADIGQVRVGMHAKIKLDAFDYQEHGVLEGRVAFVSSDSEIAETAAGEAAFFLVRIALTEGGPGIPVPAPRLGMTCRVEIVTGDASLLWLFFTKVRQSVRLD